MTVLVTSSDNLLLQVVNKHSVSPYQSSTNPLDESLVSESDDPSLYVLSSKHDNLSTSLPERECYSTGD